MTMLRNALTGWQQPTRNALLTPILFAGENARTVDQQALRRAQDMAGRGIDPETIWNDTGWFQGPDRGWRFEIDDSQMRLRPEAEAALAQGRPATGPLSQTYDYPALFDAYPGMRDVQARVRDNPQSGGADGIYHPADGIEVNNASERRRGVSGAVMVGAHETQHAIDHQMGGFAYGHENDDPDDPDDEAALPLLMDDPKIAGLKRNWDTLEARLQMLRPGSRQHEQLSSRRDDVIEELIAAVRSEKYQRQTGEEMARAVERRLHLTSEERRARPPWLDFTVPADKHLLDREPLFDLWGRPRFAE